MFMLKSMKTSWNGRPTPKHWINLLPPRANYTQNEKRHLHPLQRCQVICAREWIAISNVFISNYFMWSSFCAPSIYWPGMYVCACCTSSQSFNVASKSKSNAVYKKICKLKIKLRQRLFSHESWITLDIQCTEQIYCQKYLNEWKWPRAVAGWSRDGGYVQL